MCAYFATVIVWLLAWSTQSAGSDVTFTSNFGVGQRLGELILIVIVVYFWCESARIGKLLLPYFYNMDLLCDGIF